MSPALELQGAIVPALKSSAALSAIVAGRVFDHVPRSGATGVITAQYPFVGISTWNVTADNADCIDADEVFGRIDCWSRGIGKGEALRMAEAVRAALHNADITLSVNALAMIEVERIDTALDPDGLTSRSTVEIRALIERP